MLRSRLWILPMLLAALVAGGWYFGLRNKSTARELPACVAAAQRLQAGADVYRRDGEIRPPRVPPLALVPFAPLGALPERWQAPVWVGLSLLLLVPIFVGLHRAANHGGPSLGRPRPVLRWCGALALTVRPVYSALEQQGVEVPALLLALLAFSLVGRPGRWPAVLAGLTAGIAAAVQPAWLLVIAWFFGAGHWVAAAVAVASFALSGWLPDLIWRHPGGSWFVGWCDNAWRAFVDVGSVASGTRDLHDNANQSLAGTMGRLFAARAPTSLPAPGAESLPVRLAAARLVELSPGVATAVTLLARAALVLGLVVAVLRGRGAVRASGGDPEVARRLALGTGGLVACAAALLAPVSTRAAFLGVIVAATFCVDHLLRARRDVATAALVVLALLIGTATARGVVGPDWSGAALAWGAVTWSAVLLFVATSRVLRRLA